MTKFMDISFEYQIANFCMAKLLNIRICFLKNKLELYRELFLKTIASYRSPQYVL